MVGVYSFSYSFRTLNATFDHTEVFFPFSSVLMSCMINQKFLSYKVNFKDFYTKLTTVRYKTYQTGFSFCRLGHAPQVELWGAGGAQGVKKMFFKHGHVEYQIDWDDDQNRMQVKFSS